MVAMYTMNTADGDNIKPGPHTLQVRLVGAATYVHNAPPSHGDHAPGISFAELQHMSSRPYGERVSDQNDFASLWESTIIPSLEPIMAKHCDSDYSVDVQAFPELSSEAVSRVICITTDASNLTMEDEIAIKLGDIVSSKFAPLWLKFQQGGINKTSADE